MTLLGPLPPDWRIILGQGPSSYALVPNYKNLRTNGVAGDDPRLTALPEEWRKISREREPDDPALFQTYKKFHTGEEINCDPRLSSNESVREGVKLKRLTLYQDTTVT